MKAKKNRSIASRLTLIIVAMILVSTVAVGVLGYVFYRGDSLDLGGQRALSIAESVASGINGDELEAIMASGEEDENWHRAKDFLDGVITRTDITYLYVLSADYSDTVTYFTEGIDPASGEVALELGETEDASDHADELFETISSGESTPTAAYTSDDFGTMVSGYAPIFNSAGKVVGVVGADLAVGDVLAAASAFGLRTLIIVAATCIIMGLISVFMLRRSVGRPIGEITKASEQMALGDMDIDLSIQSDDEIGRLADSFRDMAQSTSHQVELLEKLAGGDLTIRVQSRGPKDVMSLSMQQTVDNLSEMFGEIGTGTDQVSTAAAQIADGAQLLAQGATEQSSTIETLAAAIADVAAKTQENADNAQQAATLADNIRSGAENSSTQMEQMVKAVGEINEASQKIGQVIQVIDEIASQTNILALNAAVEAARAGEHGKGFAVVAEEVRSLAARSAASAKDTANLVDDSLDKTSLGVSLAAETSASLAAILADIDESERLVQGIASASQDQTQAISDINTGIDQVAQVVQQNSATAEESAATSEEMSSQSATLQALAGRFITAENAHRHPALMAGPESPDYANSRDTI